MIVRVAGREIPTDPRVVWSAIRLEATTLPRSLWAWLAFLGILMLLGAAGAVRSLFPGDKGIATTPSFEWGILIVGYVFFAITTSGLCLASSLGTVFGIERFRPLERRHAILAVLCLVTAFGIIALDLHYPVRMVFGAVFNPSPSSPMWWMGVFYGIYLCFLLTEVWSMFRGHPRIHQMACLLSSSMAIIAPATLGAVFGVLAARPFWYGAFTPILMVASAVLSGTALLGIVFWAVQRLRLTGFERAASLAIPAIRSLLTVALVIVACLVVRQVIAGLNGQEPGMAAATRALLTGPLALEFWGLRVIGGLALPLVILLLPRTRTPTGVFAAACLSIVGVFVDRLTFVAAGQIAPTTAASGVVSSPYAAYAPSLVEVSILVGAAALVAFLYTLAERYLDLGESEVHVGLLLPVAWARWRETRLRPVRAIAARDDGELGIEAATATETPVPRAPVVEPGGVAVTQVPRAAAVEPREVAVQNGAVTIAPEGAAVGPAEGAAVEAAAARAVEPAPPEQVEFASGPRETEVAAAPIAARPHEIAAEPGEAGADVTAAPVAPRSLAVLESGEPPVRLPPETAGGTR